MYFFTEHGGVESEIFGNKYEYSKRLDGAPTIYE